MIWFIWLIVQLVHLKFKVHKYALCSLEEWFVVRVIPLVRLESFVFPAIVSAYPYWSGFGRLKSEKFSLFDLLDSRCFHNFCLWLINTTKGAQILSPFPHRAWRLFILARSSPYLFVHRARLCRDGINCTPSVVWVTVIRSIPYRHKVSLFAFLLTNKSRWF